MSFKVSLRNSDSLQFGDEISLHLMSLDGNAVLHISDRATRFLATDFLDDHRESFGQPVDGIWLLFMYTRCTSHIAFRNWLRTDHAQHLCQTVAGNLLI